jgi:hypothetical protein
MSSAAVGAASKGVGSVSVNIRAALRKVPVVVGLAAAVGALVLPGSASTASTTKAYTANICAIGPCAPPVTPPNLAGGATTTVALTIVNKAGTQSLGSMNVTPPAGFTVNFVLPFPGGSSISNGVIKLRNLAIAAGGTQTFTINVKVPCQAPVDPAWTILAKQSNDFNGPPGNAFTLAVPNSSLTTPVTGACKLVFIDHPTNAQVGRTITKTAYNPAADPVTVEVHDGSDALVTTATGSVTLGSSPSASFSGATSTLSGGVATFPSLTGNAAGTYTLTASGTGFADSLPSNSFKIGSKLVFLSQPQDATSGATITSVDLNPSAAAVQVAVVPPDAVSPYTGANAPIASATGSTTLTPSPTGSFNGTSASFSSGVASFSSLKGTATGTFTVTANDANSSTAATSDPFAITDFGAICPAGDTTCTGNAGTGKTKASVTSTTPDGFDESTTLEITMLASGPPPGACADFPPVPGSQGVSVDVRPVTDLTEVTITLDKSIVNALPDNGAAHFNICFGGKIVTENPATTPFPTKPGTPAAVLIDGLYWGILPDCSGTPTTPCVASRNKTGSGNVVIVFEVPYPWDLKGYGS